LKELNNIFIIHVLNQYYKININKKVYKLKIKLIYN